MCLLRFVLFSACFVTYPALAQSDKLARGKYLVEEIGRCQECHTPRLPDGELDRTKWLKGTVQNVQPIEPIKNWHKTSPDLTAASRLWQRWGDGGMLKFLTTGVTPSGGSAGPPMPTYKMRQEDAEAIVEYLKSLK